jgi:hypothetical protein
VKKCAACNRSHVSCGGGGVWLQGNGKPIIYTLCVKCGADMKVNPQPVLELIELRLGTPRGNA